MKNFTQTKKATHIVTLLSEAYDAAKEAGQEFPCREFESLTHHIDKIYKYARAVKNALHEQELKED